VLSMTDNAVTEIRNIVTDPQVPETGGVRIASGPDGGLTLAVAGEPASGDAIVAEQGARVFVDEPASQLLEDMQLDAALDPEGNVQFSLAQRA
jgi:iron-sulfur cluster assembly protein